MLLRERNWNAIKYILSKQQQRKRRSLFRGGQSNYILKREYNAGEWRFGYYWRGPGPSKIYWKTLATSKDEIHE